jgi:autotransporter translocation and assembly factor TamB
LTTRNAPAKPRQKRPLRTLFLGCGALILLLLLTTIAGLFWLNSDGGKSWILARINDAVGTNYVELGGLSGDLFSRFEMDRLQLRDDRGVYLVLDGLTIAWQPLDLLDKRLTIPSLEIAHARLDRLPVFGPEKPEDQAFSLQDLRLPDLAMPRLPDLPLAIEIGRITIKDIALDPSIAQLTSGRAVTLLARLDHIRLADQKAMASLVIEQTAPSPDLATDRLSPDLATDRLSLDLDYEQSQQKLDLRLDLHGPQNGLITALLAMSPNESLDIHLEGAGRLNAWQGTFSARMGEAKSLEARITGNETALVIKGHADPAGLIDPPYAALLGASVAFVITAGQDQADHIPLKLELDLAAGTVALETALAKNGPMLSALTYRLDAPQSAALLPDGWPLTFSGMAIDGRVQPTTQGLVLDGGFNLDAPASNEGASPDPQTRDPQILAQKLDGRYHLGIEGSEMSLKLSGQIHDLIIAGLSQTTDQPMTVDFNLDAVANEKSRQITLGTASLSTGGARLTASGTASTDLATLDLELLAEIADLASLPLPLPFQGGLESRFLVNRQNADAPIGLTLDGRGLDLASTDATLTALLGAEPVIKAQIDLEPDQQITIKNARLDAAGLKLDIKGAADLADEGFDLDYQIRLPDLARFGWLDAPDMPGTAEMEGGLLLDGTLGGPFSAPQLALHSHLDQLDLAGLVLHNLQLDGLASLSDPEAANETGPMGEIRLSAESSLGPLRIEARGHRDADGAFSLPLAFVALGAAKIEGSLIYGTDSLLRGEFNGQSGDLSDLPESQRYGLEGDLSLKAALFAHNEKQALSLEASGQSLVLPIQSKRLTLQRLDLKAEAFLTDGLPRIDGTLLLSDFLLGFTQLSRLQISATGDRSRLQLDGKADGHWRGPLDLGGSLIWSQEAQSQKASLSLDGLLFGEKLSTEKPLSMQMAKDHLTLDPFRIEFSEGAISGAMTKGEAEVDLRLDLADMPLSILNVMSPQILPTGTLDGQLSFTQEKDQSRGTMRLFLHDLAPAIGGFTQVPPLQISIKADLKDDLLMMMAEGSARDALEANARLTLPLRLDLVQPAFDLPDDAPLEGEMIWQGALAPLFMILDLPQQEASGDLDATIKIAGTVESPEPKGTISLKNGRYEHLPSGFIATDLALDARLDGLKLTIESLAAQDGNGGRISGAGSAGLSPEGEMLADLDLSLDGVTVVRRVEARAVTSAQLKFEKSPAIHRLSGRIDPTRADIDISKSLPDDVTSIEVTEIDSRVAQLDGESDDAGDQGLSAPDDRPLALDLKIAAPRRIFIRGRGLDSEWALDLDIDGSADTPLISGSARLVKGAFDFAGRRLILDNGQILLTGNANPDPLLDITARDQIDGLAIILQLSGPLSAPVISLQSTPSLPEDEILARLLFGEQVSDLTPLEAMQLASALASLSGGGGLDVIGAARSTLGLDRLNIDMGGEDTGGTRLTGGKYLTDDIYLEISTETGTGITTGTIEWALTRNLGIRSEMSSSKDNSVSLRWSWSY